MTSYHFSRFFATFGWATWADRWRSYDPSMSDWPELRQTDWLDRAVASPREEAYCRVIFDQAHAGMDTWDYAWGYACMKRDGLSIRPTRNLVENIGMDGSGTHNGFVPGGGPRAAPMEFPLVHPQEVAADAQQDAAIDWHTFSGVLTRNVRALRSTSPRASRPEARSQAG